MGRALQSAVGVADEIIVVDCGSTDRTAEIARAHGAKVVYRVWTNFGDQRNFAVTQSSHEWIYTLDADEALSDELRTSLLDWKQKEAEFSVYEGPRLTRYLGEWIRHSGWYPNLQRRLYRKNAAHYEGVVHETLVFEGKTGRLEVRCCTTQ